MKYMKDLFSNYEDNITFQWLINEIYSTRWLSGNVDNNSSPKELMWKAKSIELDEVLTSKCIQLLMNSYEFTFEQSQQIINNKLDFMTKPIDL